MGKHSVALVALALLVVSTTHCEALKNKVALAEKNSGETVKLGLGDALEVTLKENPTTGYVWKTASIDRAILEQVDKKEYKSASDAIGAGGRMTLRFRAVGKGETTLKLIYHRPWEKNKPAAKTFEVKIVVRAKS